MTTETRPAYRMSSYGGCTKSTVELALGATPLPVPDSVQARFDAGNEHEEACITAMRAEGFIISGEQAEVVIDCGSALLVGHLDGITIGIPGGDTTDRVLEIKSPGAYTSFERAVRTNTYTDPLAHRYAWQVSAYMVATGLEAVIACWSEEAGVAFFVIEEPIHDKAAIRTRVLTLYDAVANLHAPDTCDVHQWPCPYVFCPQRDKPPATPITDPHLVDIISRYEREKAREAAAAKLAKTYRAEIDKAVTEVGSYEAGDVEVTVYTQSSGRWDEVALREFYGEGVLRFKDTKPSNRLKVNRKDGT